MVLGKISYDPGPAAIKDPHNLHSKRALQGIFREEGSGSFFVWNHHRFACLLACTGNP
jgi:hypothetical protein